jgi:hypothetical protein
MVSNYISIDHVIEKINRFKLPGGYWNVEEIKEWAYEALEAIGDRDSKIKATKIIEITDNKGKIPADVQSIHEIKYDDKSLQLLLPNRDMEEDNYVIVNGFIYTNLKENKVKITINYYTVPLDENGNILIPDNRLYISAIEAYLQYMIGKRAFFQGKILGQQYQMLEQEWLFYLPAAINSQKLDIMKDPDRFSRIHNKFVF